MSQKLTARQVTDDPLVPSIGVLNPPTGSHEAILYYRNLVAGNGLVITKAAKSITIGISSGAGTVSEINGITGSLSITAGNDINIVNSTDIRVNVLSNNLNVASTIPKRDSNGNFEVGTPTSNLHVTNKEYVDSVAQGLTILSPVRATQSTSLGTISGTSGGGVDVVFSGTGIGKTLTNDGTQAQLVVDGVTMVNGDRVLIANDGLHSGIYDVTDQGSGSTNWVLTRSTDADENSEVVSGIYVFVSEGTLHQNAGFTLSTANPIIVDTTSLTFTQFNSAGSVTASNVGSAGYGVFKQKNGNVLEFYNINAGSTKTIVIDDTSSNNEIDLDVNEAALNLNAMVGPLFPERGGTGLTSIPTNKVVVGTGLGAANVTKDAPTGAFIGTTDTQTLTNKTINDATNTVGATHLRNTSGSVEIGSSSAPSTGQILTATSGTTATWQDQTSLTGVTTPTRTALGFGANVSGSTNGLAIGDSSISSATNSIAIGPSATGSANEVIALGRNTVASHTRAFVIGTSTSSNADNQIKFASYFTTLNIPSLTNVGDSRVIGINSSGNIGPSTNGAIQLPSQIANPTNAVGGVYFNTSTNKLLVSTGTVWNELATTSKDTTAGLVLAGNPNVVNSFADTQGSGVHWRYTVKSTTGANVRAGTITAAWDAGTNAITYAEQATADVGDTSPVTFTVDINSNNVRLLATVTGGLTWDVTYYQDIM